MLGCGNGAAYESELLEEYLKNKVSSLESGRYPLYGCPECGDIGCGAITMQIEIEKNKVIWKNFALETAYDEAIFEDYEHIKPLKFDLKQYSNVLETIKKN